MPKPIFVDTLFVIALINRRDQYHDQAIELSARYADRCFLVTEAVLYEIGNALARRWRREAAEVLSHFLASDDVEIVRPTTELFDEAFALYRSHTNKTWGLTDCLSFVVMRRAGVMDGSDDIRQALRSSRIRAAHAG